MAWPIISVSAPAYLVYHPHNYDFRKLEQASFGQDVFAPNSPGHQHEGGEAVFAPPSPSQQSEDGTPAPEPLPPEMTLCFTTGHFPRDPGAGFVFGTDEDKCDVLIPSLPGLDAKRKLGISRRHFAITFDTRTRVVLLRNLSKRKTRIRIVMDNESIRLETQRAFREETIEVHFHGLSIKLTRPWGDHDVPACYTSFLANLANAAPNLGAIQLQSEPSTTSSTSHQRSAYSSETCVGSGTFGTVYRAQHRQTGNFVAIKRYKKGCATAWKESSILCKLNHRHIIAFHHFNLRDGQEMELVMEYATLGSMIDEGRASRFTVREGQAIIKQTLQALDYLHGKSITHRDIKPGNILLTTRDPIHAKLADFGVSSEDDHHRTFCGTDVYAAPEILSHQSYTSKVDIWSVGVIVMELWIRLPKLPKKRDPSWPPQLLAHLAKQPPNKATEMLYACLQVNPDDRPAAEQCLKLPFFGSDLAAEKNQPLHTSELEAENHATARFTVARSNSSMPDTAPYGTRQTVALDMPTQQEAAYTSGNEEPEHESGQDNVDGD